MKTGKIFFTIAVMMAFLLSPRVSIAQSSAQRLYFDHRGRVSSIDGDRVVINDRTYIVLSTVTLLSIDQKPLVGLSHLKSGDYIGFTIDDKHRIEAIYLLNPPEKVK